ncbi:MAG TPA: hypothetical protein VIL01_10235 [Thermomicrobiales bacterium]
MRQRVCLVTIWLFGVALLSPIGAAGQTASPTPDAPPPELCQALPRSFEEIATLLATPEAAMAATRTPGPAPEGPPADPETVAGIEATVRELVACYNAGELLRAYGLYTDAYLQRLLARQGPFPRAVYDGLATPEPAPIEQRTAIVSIVEARMLGPDKAGAVVTLAYARVPMPKTFFMTFVREGERWLIDDILGEITFSVP